MLDLKNYLQKNLVFLFLSAFWLFALLNPVFKKYDYGAGFPLVILFAISLIGIVFLELKKKQEKDFLEKTFLLIFILFYLISFVFSSTKNIGFSEVLAWLSVISLYFLLAYQKINWKEKFLKIIKIGAIISVFIGFFMYFSSAIPRMFGPFFNILYHANIWPNAFALFLLMIWPLFLLQKKSTPKAKKSINIMMFFLPFILSALALTFSRGAWIVFLGQILLFGIYFFPRFNIKKTILVILIGIFSFGIFWGSNFLRSYEYEVLDVEEKITFSGTEAITSKQERLDFWKGSLELIKEKPLFGFGPFSFRYAYNQNQTRFLGNSDHPHNIFLKIGVENGLITLLAFLAFLLVLFIKIIKRFPKLSKYNKDFVFILGVSVISGFTHNLIDYNFNFFANLLLLFLLIIFIRSIIIKSTPKTNKISVKKTIPIFLIGILALYETMILGLSHFKDITYLENSFYPRNYYLATADKLIYEEEFELSREFLKKQIKLNPLDSKGFYLMGISYCKDELVINYKDECYFYLKNALVLNPLNDFVYYKGYFKILSELKQETQEFQDFIQESLDLLEIYFIYVQNNIHWTGYTRNVESASELINLLTPYLPEEKAEQLKQEQEKMLIKAEQLRSEILF